MNYQRKRQQSLRQLPAIQKYQTFSGSPKVLPTISEIKEAKKNTTKELTQFISKFNNNNSKQGLKFSEQLLRSAVAVLKGFSQTQNNFQNLFLDLLDVFRRFTFVMDDPEIQIILKEYKVKSGYSFRRTCFMLESQLQNVMKQKNEKFKELSNQFNQLQNEAKMKENKWSQQRKFLESEVERFKKLADIEYMKGLEESVQILKNAKEQLQIQCSSLTKRNDQYLKEIDIKQNIIHEQSYQIAKLKSQLFDVRFRVDKDEKYFNQMRDRFDGLLVKMMGLKEIIAKVQEENNTLVSERMKMVNRAAVAFEDLTPRPKYNEVFGFNKKIQINSTGQIFQKILERYSQSRKQIFDKIVTKKKHNKLQQAEALRDKVVDDIIIAKKQMDKVQKH